MTEPRYSGPSSPSAATPAPADPSAPAFSSASPVATVGGRLGPLLSSRDLELFSPADPAEAEQAIAEVADYCRRYCPARLACVEDECRLYRVEHRAGVALGYRHGPSEEVGVQPQSIIGL